MSQFVRFTIAKASTNLSGVVHEAEDGHPVVLTRRGHDVAVVITMQEYLALKNPVKTYEEAADDFLAKYRLAPNAPENEDLQDYFERTSKEIRMPPVTVSNQYNEPEAFELRVVASGPKFTQPKPKSTRSKPKNEEEGISH